MKSRIWILGLVVGAVVGLLVASAITFLDWRLNPGGIFHNAQGTDWAVVTETAISWFAPVSVLVGFVSISVLYWLQRQR